MLKLGNLGAATVRKDAKLIRSSGSTRALIGQCSGLEFSYGLRLGSTVPRRLGFGLHGAGFRAWLVSCKAEITLKKNAEPKAGCVCILALNPKP